MSAGLARWPGRKKLPSLQYLLGQTKKGPKKILSADEMNSNARAWGHVLKRMKPTPVEDCS